MIEGTEIINATIMKKFRSAELKRNMDRRLGMINEILVDIDVIESPNSAVVFPTRKKEKMNRAPRIIEKGIHEKSGLIGGSLNFSK